MNRRRRIFCTSFFFFIMLFVVTTIAVVHYVLILKSNNFIFLEKKKPRRADVIINEDRSNECYFIGSMSALRKNSNFFQCAQLLLSKLPRGTGVVARIREMK